MLAGSELEQARRAMQACLTNVLAGDEGSSLCCPPSLPEPGKTFL